MRREQLKPSYDRKAEAQVRLKQVRRRGIKAKIQTIYGRRGPRYAVIVWL